MQAQTRRAVAYIAARIISNRNASAVYDYGEGKYFSIDGQINGAVVSVFDYSEHCHVDGTLPDLYHYGNQRHIEVKVNGRSFEGYDYDSKKHFAGNVNGQSISLYDYEHGKYFNYSI
jgi:hypothetical protein